MCLFEEAYNKCPIIDLVRGTMYYQSNKEISENSLFEITINNAYVKSDQALKNLYSIRDKNEQKVASYTILLEALNNSKNYFSKWSKKIVSAHRITEEIKMLSEVEEFLSVNANSKFFTLKKQLNEIKKDNSKDSEPIRIEIVKIGLETIENEIRRIESILKETGNES